MKVLTKNGLLETRADGVNRTDVRFHLEKESPIFRSFAQQVRNASSAKLANLYGDEVNFLATFSASRKEYDQVKIKIHKLIEDVEKLTSDAQSEEVFQFEICFFPWDAQEDSRKYNPLYSLF